MRSFRLSRRGFLRGLVGGSVATVGLPVLEAMLDSKGALAGGAAPPRRLVCFLMGNGVLLERWIPAATGAAWELSDELAPLVDVKPWVNVLTGFENKHPDVISGHHEGMAGMWSGHPVIWQPGGLQSSFGGPSIDQLVSRLIADQTTYRSLQLGVSKRVSTLEGPTLMAMSHRSTAEPLVPETNPRAVFSRIFHVPEPDDVSGASRVDVLDAVLDDARALRQRVGAADRVRLDAHLESLSVLQAQIGALPPICTLPGEPTEENVDVDGLEPMEAAAAAMIELLVYAFHCDLTRVATFMLSPPLGSAVYHFLGQTDENHNMSHDPATYGAELHAISRWNTAQLAALLAALADPSRPEGDKVLLDNCVVLAAPEISTGPHTLDDMPVIVAGGGTGSIRTPGIHHRDTNRRNLSDILLTCCQLVAPSLTSIGTGPMRSTTVVDEILL